jgi:hypothetical protein
VDLSRRTRRSYLNPNRTCIKSRRIKALLLQYNNKLIHSLGGFPRLLKKFNRDFGQSTMLTNSGHTSLSFLRHTIDIFHFYVFILPEIRMFRLPPTKCSSWLIIDWHQADLSRSLYPLIPPSLVWNRLESFRRVEYPHFWAPRVGSHRISLVRRSSYRRCQMPEGFYS